MARLRVELPEGYRFESCGVYFFLPFLPVSRSNLAPRGHYLPRKPRAQARGSVYLRLRQARCGLGYAQALVCPDFRVLPPARGPVTVSSPRKSNSHPVGQRDQRCRFSKAPQAVAVPPRLAVSCVVRPLRCVCLTCLPGNPGRKPGDRCTAGSGCFGFGLSH